MSFNFFTSILDGVVCVAFWSGVTDLAGEAIHSSPIVAIFYIFKEWTDKLELDITSLGL